MIIHRSLTFPTVDMTWLDSDGKYHILCWVSIFEIITMFRVSKTIIFKNMISIISYNKIAFVATTVNIFNYYWISFIISELLLIKMILLLYF